MNQFLNIIDNTIDTYLFESFKNAVNLLLLSNDL